MEVHSTIYDSKILNLWTTKPCFEIIHGLLVSVFDKVSKPKLSRFTTRYSSCSLQNAIFRKAKIVQKQKEQVIHFLRQLVGDKVVCSCTKLHWKPVECLRVITRWSLRLVLDGAIYLDDSFEFMIYHCLRLKAFRHEWASLNRIAADKLYSVIVV